MAQQILFIKWEDRNLIHLPIVDEQHRGMVATINSLYYFILQGWDLNSLKPTVLMLEQYVKFHLKTEEMILKKQGISSEDMQTIHEYSENFLSQLHKEIDSAIETDEPETVAKFLARWWMGHKTEFHDKLQEYFQ